MQYAMNLDAILFKQYAVVKIVYTGFIHMPEKSLSCKQLADFSDKQVKKNLDFIQSLVVFEICNILLLRHYEGKKNNQKADLVIKLKFCSF